MPLTYTRAWTKVQQIGIVVGMKQRNTHHFFIIAAIGVLLAVGVFAVLSRILGMRVVLTTHGEN